VRVSPLPATLSRSVIHVGGSGVLERLSSWLWRDASAKSDAAAPRLNRLRASIVVLIAALASSFAARVLLHNRVDSDTLWHIRTGQWILEHGRIPTTDVFSWIGPERGLAWTPHEWLFDVVLWPVYSKTGFEGVYLLTSLAVGAFAALILLLAYRRSANWPLSVLISLVSTVGVAPAFAPRPQVATLVLLAAVAFLLEVRRPYAAIVVTIIGINIHGAMYPVYLGLFAFYCLPRRSWVPMLLAAPCSGTYRNERSAQTMAGHESHALPPIDLAPHARFETATFALG
jgi:hypothetical protein